jgi:hypothetical protein
MPRKHKATKTHKIYDLNWVNDKKMSAVMKSFVGLGKEEERRVKCQEGVTKHVLW